MRRVTFGVLIYIVCLVLSGCVRIGAEPSLHPHSEVMSPTFCLFDYDGSDPEPIAAIEVTRRAKENDERIEIMEWRMKTPWAARDQEAWDLKYAPDASTPSVKAFSCITYGKAPPGYKEESPALPLTPERIYTVMMASLERGDTRDWTSRMIVFIIRLGLNDEPDKLEYSISPFNSIHIIPLREGASGRR